MGAQVVPLDEHRARQLTDRIRDAAGQLWSLLAEAHDRRAWAALGYDSFREYVETELQMTKQRAYQILDQAKVIMAISQASGVESNAFDLTSREVQELKPHLDLVVRNVEDATVDTEQYGASVVLRALDRLAEDVGDRDQWQRTGQQPARPRPRRRRHHQRRRQRLPAPGDRERRPGAYVSAAAVYDGLAATGGPGPGPQRYAS